MPKICINMAQINRTCCATLPMIALSTFAFAQANHDRYFRFPSRLLSTLARAAQGHRPRRDTRMAGRLRRTDSSRGARPRHLCAAPPVRPRAQTARAPAAGSQHPLQEHHRARPAAAVPGQPRSRTAHLGDHPLECPRHGRARQPRVGRTGRPHRQLRLGCRFVRGRLQPFFQGRAAGRPGLLPAALGTRRVRARLSRGPSIREPP